MQAFPCVSADKESTCNLGDLGPIPGWGRSHGEGKGYPLQSEKAVAPHSSTLAWKIPWMEEPGGLKSMGSLRVRHDWATLLSRLTFVHWRRKWQPTAVFLPGESQGRGSLVGCRPWGHTESDTTPVFWPGELHRLYSPWGHKELDMTATFTFCKI